MKHLFKITFVLILINWSGQMYAQKIYPDKSVKINKEALRQCQKIIGDIDSMPLKCDSILQGYKITCFDKQGQLRKYLHSPNSKGPGGDGSGEYVSIITYYDENGNLVYIKHNSGSNCDRADEYYYVHNGLIVDFMLELACWCCDEGEENLNDEEINRIRPVVGSKLTKTTTWNSALTNFIRANTLLAILNRKDYQVNEEIFSIAR